MSAESSNQVKFICPSCQKKGKRVRTVTMAALLNDEYRIRFSPDGLTSDACGCTPAKEDTGYRFCESLGCEVVYFSERSDEVFTKGQLSVPVGVKEASGDRPLCYCFGHSIASIKEEIRTKGHSDASEDVRKRMQDPGCRCETENPSGSCCLGSVTKGIKIAQKELEGGASDGRCLDNVPISSKSHGETIAKIGTIVSAIVASSCCWLPLVLLALGVSGAGIASTLESYRPLFIVVTFGFLASAFYYTYRPTRKTCDANEHKSSDCCLPDSVTRFNMAALNKVVLWAVAVVAVAFLLFPSYVGAILRSDTTPISDTMQQSELTIEGMTCEGCSAIAAKSIRSVPGVLSAEVSYADGKAVVGSDLCCSVPTESILAALELAGYRGTFIVKGESP